MERVIANEMTKFLLVLGAAVLGLTALLVDKISKLKGSFKPYQKSTLIYLFISLLFFSIIGCAAYPGTFDSPISCLILFQAYFLLLGAGHFYLMHQYLRWSGDPKAFWLESLFTVLISILGSIGFLIVYRFFNKNGLQYILLGSILFFFIPLIFYQTFRKAIDIPPKILKQWFYPVDQEIEEPEDSKLKNLLVISFEFQKQIHDPHFTNFRAKAPVDMEYGQLFYYFINDYNERHADSKIEFINVSGEPHGWIFYKKPRWYSLVTNYIDAEKTIFNNHIRENEVIICARSLI